ncbi:beta-lactamase family protein [Candidatus Poribacteria bacterium]|nr:beta-lactamase family protein [Candidatus Poribacteria bacterium]
MAATIAAHPEVAAAIDLVKAGLQADVDAGETVGVSATVVIDQEIAWSGGFGLRDLASQAPATSDSVYRIASITKLFTASAIMHLRDAGKLNLDDLAATHVPEFRLRGVGDDCPPVRLRHLISHTSGLQREPDGDHWLSHNAPSTESALAALDGHPLLYPPMTQLHYSNLGFGVLGMVVERLSGMALGEYVAKHLFGPLAMSRSSYDLTARVQETLATGYYPGSGGEPPEPVDQWWLGALAAGGGIYSNVDDLSRFVMMQYRDGPAGDGQPLAGSTIREMWNPLFLHPGTRNGHGIAWAIGDLSGARTIGHGGSVDGYRTQLGILPDQRLGVAVFANTTYNTSGACNRALEILSPVLARVRQRQPKTPQRYDVPEGAQYEGIYAWKGFGERYVAHRDGELVLLGSAAAPLAGAPRLDPDGPDRFRIRGSSDDGELARFERDADGAIVRLWVGAYPHRRMSEG